ncbi:Hypothetical Protein FCC1311_101862 [Hondaea fermentalgiana]|uniref:Uncharacterized protein n=1 Tax=Hondaea fermentalgiana TaxID=2315210 RepID=A0A2R5GYZ1_9STRA|nr:Hypothetical Protein FCC1311_101862 [Hondaea fermentalgiana]|eukprot:GBG33963.1 Hypothetical Protein FCC1311_101862 [Hondaea fermentalgiana]
MDNAEQPDDTPVETIEGDEVTVFVNGLFNPKDEATWTANKAKLLDIFGCPAVHIHNPTLARDIPHERVTSLVRKNAGLAFGAALMAAAAVAVDSYLDTGYRERVIATSMDGIRSQLEPQAVTVADKMKRHMKSMCEANPNIKTINLVCHSHGGWCTLCFIREGHAEALAQDHGIKFHVFVLGSPVLVHPGPGAEDILQLHNALDPVSLRYEDPNEILESDFVRAQADRPYHSCLTYMDWLKVERNAPDAI